MRRLLPDEKTLYRLQDYAIIEVEDEKYEYVAWEPGKKTPNVLSWIRGPAVVVENTTMEPYTSGSPSDGVPSSL